MRARQAHLLSEALETAFERGVIVLNASSKYEHVAVEVIIPELFLCYSVSAQFAACMHGQDDRDAGAGEW